VPGLTLGMTAPVATIPGARRRIVGALADLVSAPGALVTVVDQPAPGRVRIQHGGVQRDLPATAVRIRPATLGRFARAHTTGPTTGDAA